MPRLSLVLAALAVLLLAALPARAQEAGGTLEVSAEPLFAVVYRAGPAWRDGEPMAVQPGMREHFFYIRDLHASGVIVTAGPWGEDGGLILLRAADLAAARALMEADPAVAGGLFVGEVRAFDVRFGEAGA